MKPINISIENVRKQYGNKEVLKDINLHITNESFCAICGKSGAGKSTFMNILGLIEDYDSGLYKFNNQIIRKGRDYSELRLHNIGFIFQSYNLIPGITAWDNITMPLLYSKNKRIPIKKMNDIIEELGLQDLLEQNVNVLSGGEKQRVAIARALIMDPGLIIADEPTGNLDSGNRDNIVNVLKRLHHDGKGIVLITHDINVANETEKIYMIDDGRLYER